MRHQSTRIEQFIKRWILYSDVFISDLAARRRGHSWESGVSLESWAFAQIITIPKEGWSSFFVSTWQMKGTGELVGGTRESEKNKTYSADTVMRHILGCEGFSGGGWWDGERQKRPGFLRRAYPEQINQSRHRDWCCCLYRLHTVHVLFKNSAGSLKHLDDRPAVPSECFP